MNKLAAFIFPPNWSACVSGPHLAVPLLASVARNFSWDAVCFDLSATYYDSVAAVPGASLLRRATSRCDFESLDDLYFEWEDKFKPLVHASATSFGLLSGYDFQDLATRPLAEVDNLILRDGTIFDDFYRRVALPKLIELKPAVIGITIGSRHQVISALRLVQIIHDELPDTFVILGGNILSRLRSSSSALAVFQSYVDQIVIYQGECVLERTLASVEAHGVSQSRRSLPAVSGDENIPYEKWPVPYYGGIEFGKFPGNPTLSYASTRGCYWGKCNFCAIPAGWAKRGYAGSLPPDLVVNQLAQMVEKTAIPRVKFVDEAIAPSKVRRLSNLLGSRLTMQWEAYARLDRAWEDVAVLEAASAAGLRKLYFGMEQAPTTNRKILNKNDSGDILKIMKACDAAKIKLHFFCMVGHPYSGNEEASATTQFLIDHQEMIDTADLVGFRLDSGTVVPGATAYPPTCDWELSHAYQAASGVLPPKAVEDLEFRCQEMIWDTVPRLLHPLYRLISPWDDKITTSSDGHRAPQALSVSP
jgi:hypothetical protein